MGIILLLLCFVFSVQSKNFSIEILNAVKNGFSGCAGKEKTLEILQKANIHRSANCHRLPTWKSVSDLYGDEPVIYGLETCETYRELLKQQEAIKINPRPRVAGLQNSGTNALAELFKDNFPESLRLGSMDAPWGKAFPIPDERNLSTELIFPVVIVRDPYRWMQSMCRFSYAVSWKRNGLGGVRLPRKKEEARSKKKPSSHNCPNLVVDGHPNPVSLHNPQISPKHYTYPSLADHWSQWNFQYYNLSSPRLMIRFEDILFHVPEVLKAIFECLGIQRGEGIPFRYHTERAKNHGGKTDFVDAIIKYGTSDGRTDGYESRDLNYAKKALDSELMNLFHYNHPPI